MKSIGFLDSAHHESAAQQKSAEKLLEFIRHVEVVHTHNVVIWHCRQQEGGQATSEVVLCHHTHTGRGLGGLGVHRTLK